MQPFQVQSPRRRKKKGGYVPKRLVSQRAPSGGASHQRTTYQAERQRAEQFKPILRSLDHIVQQLERNGVPPDQWARQAKHLADLAARDRDMGGDLGDTGFVNQEFDDGYMDSEAGDCQNRLEDSQFNLRGASDLETDDNSDSDDDSDSDDALESMSAAFRSPTIKTPRSGISEAKRKTQSKMHNWGNFIDCFAAMAKSGSAIRCHCMKVTVSLPAVSLNGIHFWYFI
jgi:hypothetical protein